MSVFDALDHKHERVIDREEFGRLLAALPPQPPVYQTVEKPVPVVSIPATQHQEEVAVPVKHEQPLEGSVPPTEKGTVQVAKCMTQAREVLRQPETCQVQVEHEAVPVELMRQKAQYVPQVQSTELIKEVHEPLITQIQKSVTKYQMQCVTNKIKVGPKYMENLEEVAEWDEEWVFFNGYRIACFTLEFIEKLDLSKLILHSNFLYHAIGFTDPFPFTNNSGDGGPVLQWIIDVQEQYLAQHRGLQYEVQMVEYQGSKVRMIPKRMLYTLPEKELKAYALELSQVVTWQVLGRRPPKSSTHETEALLQYIERAQGCIFGQETGAAQRQSHGLEATIRVPEPAKPKVRRDPSFGGFAEFDEFGMPFAGPGLPAVQLPFRPFGPRWRDVPAPETRVPEFAQVPFLADIPEAIESLCLGVAAGVEVCCSWLWIVH